MASYEKEVALPDDFVQLFTGAPDNDVTLTNCRAIYIGVGGTLNLTMLNGHEVDDLPVQAGILPGRFAAVRTGGTAQNIWMIT